MRRLYAEYVAVAVCVAVVEWVVERVVVDVGEFVVWDIVSVVNDIGVVDDR